MAFEDVDMDEMDSEPGGSPPPEESNNRSFLIVAGILGGIALLALICIAVYALVLLPAQRNRQAQQVATLNAQNTAVDLAFTQTSMALAATATPTVTPIPPTWTSTPTAVIAVATNTKVPTIDPRTATVSALLTQAALVTQTVVPTSTALPGTGFADDVGLPAMLGLAALFLVIIFLSRRLRTS